MHNVQVCEVKCEGFLSLHLSFILCMRMWEQGGYRPWSACNENIDTYPKKFTLIRKQQLGSLSWAMHIQSSTDSKIFSVSAGWPVMQEKV